MSTFLAAGLALLLWPVLAVPALMALRRPRAAMVVAPLYFTAFIGLAAFHVGLLGSQDGSAVARWRAANDQSRLEARGAGSICDQVVREAERGRLILDRSHADQVVVNRDLWGQLPQQVQDAIVSCLGENQPGGLNRRAVQVVQGEPD